MLTTAAHQSKVYAINYGLALDSEFIDKCMSKIDNPKFDGEIAKFNVNGTVIPPISEGKNFDPSQPSYIAVQLAPKDVTYTTGVWNGIRCINMTLTNTKPQTDIEKACPKFTKLFETNYKNVTAADCKAALTELEKICK